MPVAVGVMADSYNKPAGGWTPASIAGLQAWWDPSNASSITHASGAVSQINDLSGNGRHLIQANATYRPTTGTHTINGLNVLRFPGAKVLATANVTLPQPLTVAVVAQGDAVNTGQRVFGAATYLGTQSFTTGAWYYGAPTAVSPGAAWNHVAAPTLIVLLLSGSSSYMRMNSGGLVAGPSNAGTGGWSAAPFLLGANNTTGGTGWRELIAEVVIYNTVLTGGDLTNLESYMKARWGTP